MNMLDSLCIPSSARSRSITAENVYGEKGRGGMARPDGAPQEEVQRLGQIPESSKATLGHKWKARPFIYLEAAATTTLADIDGPGCFRHLWMTVDAGCLRDLILRCYWDGETEPSVEVPLGDFFCNAAGYTAEVRAIPVCVNPANGMNCYFPMPFRTHAKITIENRRPERRMLFYALNYEELDTLPGDTLYFHARFHRTNPTDGKADFVILDGVEGRGHFCGCYLTWQQNNAGWWGEGEFKAYLDGDAEFPTICGTGTEDYFGGAWGFRKTFTTPFLGYPCGGENKVGGRHSLYRFHILDPIRFERDIRITIQTLGWHSEHPRYLLLKDDISATAYWYQSEPHCVFPALQERDELEVI